MVNRERKSVSEKYSKRSTTPWDCRRPGRILHFNGFESLNIRTITHMTNR